MKLKGSFFMCSLEPEGIVEMSCQGKEHADRIAKELGIVHYSLSGLVGDDVKTVYEVENGLVLVDLFEE